MRILSWLVLVCLALTGQGAQVLYVDAARPDDAGDGLSWGAAKRSIQAAVDLAEAGCRVWVTNGVYRPFVRLDDLPLSVASVNGAAVTVIEQRFDEDDGYIEKWRDVDEDMSIAARLGRWGCVTLGADASHTNTVLSGFTLRKGHRDYGGGSAYGTLNDCVLSNNTAVSGGAAYHGVLNRCWLIGNSGGGHGSGAADGCVLNDCVVEGNGAPFWSNAGGVCECALNRCVLMGNIGNHGGAALDSVLTDCLVVSNKAFYGAGVRNCRLVRCTVAANQGAVGGGMLGGSAEGCIVWGNSAWRGDDCVSDAVDGWGMGDFKVLELLGENVVAEDPQFVDFTNGDFRLRASSPAVSNGVAVMGQPTEVVSGWVVSAQARFDGEVSPRTAVVQTGGRAEFSAVETGARFVCWETNGVAVSSNRVVVLEGIAGDVALTAVFERQVLYVDVQRPDDDGDGLSWATAKREIQAAIDVARPHAEIVVAAGSYKPIKSYGKLITIRSVEGPLKTAIVGRAEKGCAELGEWCVLLSCTVLNGFTLTHGKYGAWGGVLEGCIIEWNGSEGGAVHSVLNDCLVRGNATRIGGGGAKYCFVNNCTVVGNVSLSSAGGGTSDSYVRHSIVWGNQAPYHVACWEGLVEFCCLDDLEEGEGNIDAVPQFVNPVQGDFELKAGSPCVGMGAGIQEKSSK